MKSWFARWWKTLLTLVVLFGLLFPIFYDMPHEPAGTIVGTWRRTVFDFQTLFAGVLAVAAAYATIQQARKSDARNDERHEELIRLGRYREGLEIERALYPTLSDLEGLHRDLKMAEFPEIIDPEGADEGLYEKFGVTVTVVCDLAMRIREKLPPLRTDQVTKLFNGRLTASLKELHERVEQLASQATTAIGAKHTVEQWRDGGRGGYPKGYSERTLAEQILNRNKVYAFVPIRRKEVLQAFEPVLSGLREVAKLYDLKV